ncbi:MAG: MFS transporter [Armatimonadetes bacterium]|nr:MFS transporter [Armatimonadota bacterium]
MSVDETYDPIEVRRSFRLLSMDVIFYLVGLALIDTSTVVPAFLSTLTSSAVVIGAISAIRPAGLFIPQLWTAHYLRSRARHLGFLLKVASVSRIAIALFAVVLFVSGPMDKTLMLAAFLVMYSAFWFSEGGAGVPWTDLVAKTIPERLRGRLFGFTQFGGGLLGLAAGLLVSRMLSPRGPAYPTNYAIICGTAAIFFAASFFSLAAVREPEGPVEEHDGDFLQYIKGIGTMLAGHAELKRFLAVQLLICFYPLSSPFYIIYAKESLGIGGAMVGIFLSAQIAGSIVASAIAGYVSDHLGPKRAIIMSVGVGIFAPLIALLAGGVSVWMYGLVFVALGAVNGSTWIGLTNYLLEMADPKERRSYIGLMNSANTPAMFFPILGGLIAQTVSYRANFVVTGVALVLALVVALGLVSRKRQ